MSLRNEGVLETGTGESGDASLSWLGTQRLLCERSLGEECPARLAHPAHNVVIRDDRNRKYQSRSYLRAIDKRHLSWETTRKCRGLLKGRLLSWCEREQLTALRALSVTRMDDFRETWSDGLSYAVNVERLRALFQFCVDHDSDRPKPGEGAQDTSAMLHVHVALYRRGDGQVDRDL